MGAREVALIGALGGDEIARKQINALENEGVITEGIDSVEGVESGQAYIMIDQTGRNIIATHLGANARLSLGHLNKAQVKQQLQGCRGIVLTDPGRGASKTGKAAWCLPVVGPGDLDKTKPGSTAISAISCQTGRSPLLE
jgi:hypothetical protein